MDDSPIVEELDPEAAFSVLADSSRIDILRALWEADEQVVSFSDLRTAVGIRDSGQFNYHLRKLTDGFVRKTEDGYELRSAGRNVVGALLTGAYTMAGSIDPITLEEPCPVCSSELRFEYEDDRALIECVSCPFESTFPVPPGALADHPIEQYPSVADRYLRTLLTQARLEFCSQCSGHVRPTLSRFGEVTSVETPPPFDTVVVAVYDCDRCGMNTQINLSTVLLDHPQVAAFHHERGVDVRDVPFWRMGATDGEPQSALLEDGDGAATVTYGVDGDELTLIVDETLSVIDVEHS